jgi:hypothetical protein
MSPRVRFPCATLLVRYVRYGQEDGREERGRCNRMNRFIGSSPLVTTDNYYTIADLHNLQSLHTNPLSVFPLVCTIRFLATDL